MAKKKIVKRVSNSSAARIDNNTFLMIVGGGFVVVAIVSMFLMGSTNESQMPTQNTQNYMMTQDKNENANIVVTSPKENESVERPITITGRARVFENTISYRVKDADGFVLVSGSTIYESKDAGEFGDFSITTNYLEPKGPTGTVEVYNGSAKDGTDENLVSVPVSFE